MSSWFRRAGGHRIGPRPGLTEMLARYRVSLGFVSGAVVLWLSDPTGAALGLGAAVAAVGEALRIWAAGHLNKSREVTTSGPYRWFAHPLYVGSSIMGLGLAIASRSLVVALLVGAYLVLTIGAAVRSEEQFLRRTFGDRYDHYRNARHATPDADRRFSLDLALRNREYRAAVGLLTAVLALLGKAIWQARR